MNNAFLTTLLLIYLTGIFIAAFQSLLKWTMLIRLKNAGGVDLLTGNSFMKRFLILRVIAWPVYLFVLNNPIVLISQCFFRHYGNEGQIYFGTRGLRNFLMDVFKGKNRYRGCDAKKTYFALDKTTQAYKEYVNDFCHKEQTVYAKIIYASFKSDYLLHTIYTHDVNCLTNALPVTRFDLDDCERLDAETFKRKLQSLHPEKAGDILQKLAI